MFDDLRSKMVSMIQQNNKPAGLSLRYRMAWEENVRVVGISVASEVPFA
jgi:hypothetical protein